MVIIFIEKLLKNYAGHPIHSPPPTAHPGEAHHTVGGGSQDISL